VFQTPFGNYSRAHTRTKKVYSVRYLGVSNPFRELFSRARVFLTGLTQWLSSFKPLSGIILARTSHPPARLREGTVFQTPFGNYSRAHRSPACAKRLTSRSFKPLSGIILARTVGRGNAQIRVPDVSNPFRELFSRAPPSNAASCALTDSVSNPFRELFSRARGVGDDSTCAARMFQTPFGNYSRAHSSFSVFPSPRW